MTLRIAITALPLGGLLLTGCVDSGGTQPDSMAAAPLSSEVKALEGMRAQNLDAERNRLGFSNVGGYKSEGASVTTWWNPRGEQCVQVETRDGRADSIDSIVKGNCE